VRVPLIVYVPGAEPRRVAVKRSHIDLVPTILALFGTKADAGELSGQSLIPDMLGKKPPAERDVLLDMPVGPYTLMRKALITGPAPGKKVVWYGAKSWAVFDLASDPDETTDLASDPAQLDPLVDAMQAKRSTLSEIDVPPLPP
jgi:arylsulfatase A-like enzyme